MLRSHRLKSLVTLAAVTLFSLGFLSTPADAGHGRGRGSKQGNLVETLERQGRFQILLTALETAGLTETVATGGKFTVFAPTDDAFVALLAELGIGAEDLLASPDLTNILLYHVLAGKQSAGRLLQQSTAETLFDAQPVLVTRSGYRVMVNGNDVVRANVRSRNGVIHIIDGVLLPPTEPVTIESMVDVLKLDGRFSVLLAAVETAGLAGALSGDDDLTLFAPTDAAFVELLNELGIEAGDLLADPNLADILLYHVVGGRRGALELLYEGDVETLQGDSVFVGFRHWGIRVNDSRVINANINTPNGFIHSIDGVLLP